MLIKFIIASAISFLLAMIFLQIIVKRKEQSEERFKRMVTDYNKPPAHSLGETKNHLSMDLFVKTLGFALSPLIILIPVSMIITIPVTIIVSSIFMFLASKDIDHIFRLRKGIRAEMLVGMSLERGLTKDYTVLHDFQLGDQYNNGSNIDHLIISPQAIYIVETKYKSCPSGKEAMLKYDRNFITDPSGYKSDDHIKQVQGIIKQFKDYCKREFDIKELPLPVEGFIIYPGWRVDFSSAIHNSRNKDLPNIRVCAPGPMLTAMQTIVSRPAHETKSASHDELVRHLTKRNKVKVKLAS